MPVFAYSRCKKDVAVLESYARSLGVTIDRLFVEGMRSRWQPWRQRSQGTQLAEIVQAGDHVVFANPLCLDGIADINATLADFRQAGVILHFATVAPSLKDKLVSFSSDMPEAEEVEKGLRDLHQQMSTDWAAKSRMWEA